MPRGRPRGTTKYKTQQQRRAAARASIAPQVAGRYFRLVIPDLRQYLDPEALLALKGDTLNLLLQRQGQALQYYKVATQTHPTTGVPHLDILLLYRRSVRKSLNRFDYLVKHGDLTRYRRLNQAILSYGDKQDGSPLTNMPPEASVVLLTKEVESDPYQVLRTEMLRDPFHFDPHSWVRANNLDGALSRTNWSKAVSLIRHQQQAECNRILHDKPGFRPIDRALLESRLTSQQLRLFDSWPGYQVIVDHLNQVVTHGCRRPFKTRNLLLVGPASIGKTSLVSQPGHDRSPTVQDLTSVYHMGMRHWFPKYLSGTYRLILWDQFKLTSYPYDLLLKLLQGSPVDLPYHGGATKKDDNPLVFMTSNVPLQRHIRLKFTAEQDRQRARQNLAARITQVIVPPGVDLFLLRSLIVLVN
jgi:hypothetical protein